MEAYSKQLLNAKPNVYKRNCQGIL